MYIKKYILNRIKITTTFLSMASYLNMALIPEFVLVSCDKAKRFKHTEDIIYNIQCNNNYIYIHSPWLYYDVFSNNLANCLEKRLRII